MATDDKRLAELEADLRKRLKEVCSHMPEKDFEEMVTKIARTARRSEQTRPQWKSASGPADGSD